MKNLEIRPLEEGDIGPITTAFRDLGWSKPRSQYECYLAEQREGHRTVLVATLDDDFAGYLTIVWRSNYAPFREGGIPEIVDFNVLPRYRRRGVGTRLMGEAERVVARRSGVAGIGVGMSPDYGAAQRLYVLRGYVPDGHGLAHDGRPVSHGDKVPVDDGLALHLTKELLTELRPTEREA